MRLIYTVLLLIGICLIAQTQTIAVDTVVRLEWRVSDGDTLAYSTVMKEIGANRFSTDLEYLFDESVDSSKSVSSALHNATSFIEKIKKISASTDYITYLTNSSQFPESVDVVMIGNQKGNSKSAKDSDENRLIRSMMQGAMLRGVVGKAGGLESFWIKQAQKNLISILFELPKGELAIGDTWSLSNVNLIGNDQNFMCREALKRNQVTLVDITQRNGDVVAILDYTILEEVQGMFKSPLTSSHGDGTPTSMRFAFKGQAEFDITTGHWISYEGVMSGKMEGIMNSTQNQKFALILQQ